MNKALFISNYFPPMGLGGILRTLKLAEYLGQYDWQVVVLTVSPKKLFVVDEYLFDEVRQSGVIIERTGKELKDIGKVVTRVPSSSFQNIKKIINSWLFIPDVKIKWKNGALKKADELWKKYNEFNLIYASAPPFTNFVIAREIKAKYKIPLVIDYRDAWSDTNAINYYPTFLHKRINKKEEELVVRDADKIFTTNRKIKEIILSKYNGIKYNDIKLYPHMYDKNDFDIATKKNIPYTSKMRITYTGSLNSRGLKLFFKSIKSLIDAMPLYKKQIEFLYLGLVTKDLLRIAKEYDIMECLYMPGYLNHIEFVKYILSSDVLFMHIKKCKNGEAIYPGVLGEYIGSGKNIVACISSENSTVKSVLKSYGAAKVIEDYNPATIAEAFYDYYQMYDSNNLPNPKKETIEKFEMSPYIYDIAREFNYLVDVE